MKEQARDATIGYHNVKFIEITVNQPMLCQTNNKTSDRFKDYVWVLQLLNLHTV